MHSSAIATLDAKQTFALCGYQQDSMSEWRVSEETIRARMHQRQCPDFALMQ